MQTDLYVTKQNAIYQSLASCGAFLIAFIGTVHEVVGATLYPWAPVLFTVIGFHLIGIFVILLGLVIFCGTLRMIHVPVVPLALIASAGCAAMFVFIIIRYQEFHYFSLCGAIAGLTTAYFHAKAGNDYKVIS